MPLRPTPLPQDAAQLTRIILSLDEENADLKARIAFLEQQLFGPKSEKITAIDPTQAMLELGDLSDIPEAANDDERTIRPRYACRACESVIVQASAPARVMDGGIVTTAFAAHVAVSKFAWHLPLHRQAQMLASCGVIIDRGTLGAWVTRVAQAVDDRPWNGPASPAVAYTFAESRSAREVEGQLSSFAGVLQVDGYQAYKLWPSAVGRAMSPPCVWPSALPMPDASSSKSSR